MGCLVARLVLILCLSTALLLLPGWAQEGLTEAEASDVVTEEEKEEEVLVLKQHSFAQALQDYQLLLVAFYVPGCGHCQALAPEYEQAAAMLKNETVPLRLAKVDATEEQALSMEFGVTEYPTLKLFKDGNRTHPSDFTGQRDAEGIVKWMKRKAGPGAILLEDEAGAAAFLDSHSVAVVGFFHDLQDEDVRLFYAVASDAPDVDFALTDQPRLFQKYNITGDRVTLFRKHSEPRADFPIDEELGLDGAELAQFITVQSLELVMEFSSKNSSKIFGAKIMNHLLLFINKTAAAHLELMGPFQNAASAFRGQVLFVLVDVAGEGAQVLHYFGLQSHDAPTIRFISIQTNKKYLLPTEGLSTQVITTFCQQVLEGKVKPHLMSDKIPDDWDKHPVKILVGKNFEQVAFDETKKVFVKFYAPWCTHCKAMASVWEELGEKYKDHKDIIIAKMDATANEVEEFTIHGFPTLQYFPAGPGRKVIEYKHERTLDSFSAFLDNDGVLPSKDSPEGSGSLDEQADSKQNSSTETPDSRDEL